MSYRTGVYLADLARGESMKVLTMKDLEQARVKKLEDPARKSHRLVMHRFLKGAGKNWRTPVSDVFFNGTFTADLDAFAATKKRTASRDRVGTVLRLWEADAKELTGTDALPRDFGDALAQLIRRRDTTVAGLARTICRETGEKQGGVAKRMYEWTRHKHLPTPRRIPRVERIEDILQVSRGTLVNRMPDFIRGIGKLYKARRKYSPYAKRLARAAANRYVVDVRKVPPLKAEWDDFYRFKTAKILAEGERRKPRSRWTVRSGNKCATSDLCVKVTGLFLGFLHMEKSEDKRDSGLAIPMARLSMALLSVPSFVIRYINDFMVVRADGIYSRGVTTILVFCRQLTHKDTGYLTQHPELFARKVMFTEDWQQWIKTFPGRRDHKNLPARVWWGAWCDRSHLQYDAILRDLRHNKSIRKSRDPEYNIRAILKLDHPMEVLFTLIEEMKKRHKGDERSALPEWRAVKYRNLLLIKLLSVNPLRARNWAEMTWRRDNTGHLQQVNGVWYIRIRQDEFKNWYSGPTDKDYTVPLPPDCTPYIEQYLAYRHYLKNADACDYLFLSLTTGANKSITTPGMTPKGLGQLVEKLTRIFVPEEVAPAGFGPHAFRHIVAHSYLKNNPKAYVVVADVLNDKIETVIQEYGHVGIADNFRHWLRFYAEEQERLEGPGCL